MSDTVSIDAPPGETVESLVKGLEGRFRLASTGHGGVSIRGQDDYWIVLNPNPYSLVEDPDGMEEVARIAGGPTASFTLTTSDMGLAREVLKALGERPDLVLDTQHGLIMPLHEFAELIRSWPRWDWRLDGSRAPWE